MPNLNLVRRVLREKLLTVSGIPPKARIHVENRPFEAPEPNLTWIKETFFPVSQKRVATNTIEALGFVQWDVIVASESGTATAEALALKILDVFKPSTAISSQGVEVRIDETVQAAGRQFDTVGINTTGTWWHIPISVYWRTYSSVPS